MAEKMTVTRALAELKMLDARINKQISSFSPVDTYQRRTNKVSSGELKDEFEKKVKSDYQSIADLIIRRKKIKQAVLKSNSTTKVTVSGDKYTVVEAIDRKSSIQYDKQLLEKMRHCLANSLQRMDDYSIQLENSVQVMLEKNYGTDQRADKEAYNNIAKPFIEANELLLANPLNLATAIEALDKDIDAFLTEIDFVLSESNSKTEIEI